jgi:hypothetical protein
MLCVVYRENMRMKQYITLLFFPFVIASCCHKEYCAEAVRLPELSGFNEQELDTIYILYTSNPADTERTEGVYTLDSSFKTLGSSIDRRNDVDIIIPAADRVYQLRNFTYEEKKAPCGQCLFRKNTYQAFTGCTVNGVKQGKDIVLQK